ncbi:MAG: transglutaminase family protein [Methylocystaceae bacterium]|nr:transglutaminase family protein [Methylocystaceae bacterium]
MRYEISLEISYEYAFAASGGRHLLRMLPAHIESRQHRISGYVSVNPAQEERTDRFDFFNNAVSEIASHHSHDILTFKMLSQVECFEQFRSFNLSPDLEKLKEEMSQLQNLSNESPLHFIGDTPRVRINNDIKQFALNSLKGGMGCLDIIETIGLKLHEEMTFDPTATTVETPMEDAFKNREGVCQDYTHIMIACLRSIGIPAGYVSGFIRTIPPEGQERLEGADAMHAWVRAWAGTETGWIEYDPTNALFVNTDHIVVAYGRDYDDVAPIKGVLKMFGEQKTTQAVDVVLI